MVIIDFGFNAVYIGFHAKHSSIISYKNHKRRGFSNMKNKPEKPPGFSEENMRGFIWETLDLIKIGFHFRKFNSGLHIKEIGRGW